MTETTTVPFFEEFFEEFLLIVFCGIVEISC